MSSEVFVLSAVRNPEPAEALRLAVERAQVDRGRIQDALFGFEGAFTPPRVEDTARKAGLTCPTVSVSSGMRAVFFGAESILSDGMELIAVTGVDEGGASAMVLAGPEAIGRWNLVPRARLAARSLRGAEAALRQAEIKSEELAVVKQSESGARLLCELLDELETRQARWGMVVVGELALIVERV
jgi:acetyl-CoA acetyltransferase